MVLLYVYNMLGSHAIITTEEDQKVNKIVNVSFRSSHLSQQQQFSPLSFVYVFQCEIGQ